MKLKKLATEYLETFGWEIRDNKFYIKAVVTSPISGKSDEVIVFFDKPENILWDTYLEKIKRTCKENKNAAFYFLRETFERIPKIFMGEIRKLKIIEQIPIWFFDKQFKHEESSQVSTAMKEAKDEAKKIKKVRVPQPFSFLFEEEEEIKTQGDILNFLRKDISNLDAESEPFIILIAAPGGFGKTVLMNVLFSELLDEFYEAKKKQLKSTRPLLMLPDHLKSAIGKNLRALIQEFCKIEYMPHTGSEDTFNFLIRNGYGIWLLDGLEELFIRETKLFYDLLNDYLTADNSKTKRIIISIREPLLATNLDLINTIQEFRELNLIKVIKLREWGSSEIRRFFELNFKEDFSKEETDKAINKINETAELRKLVSVPLYCNFAADLYKNEKLKEMDENDLLEEAIKNIGEREYTKGLQKWFDINKQIEFLSELSFLKHSKEHFTKDDITIFGMALAPDEIKESEKNILVKALERHAIFGIVPDVPENIIDFKHELLEQHLLGIALEKLLSNQEVFMNEMETKLILNDSRALIYLGSKLKAKEEIWEDLFKLALERNETAFINILRLLILATQGKVDHLRDLINKACAGIIESKNLSTIKFENLNLSDISFIGSDISNTEFIKCNISGTSFIGCIIKNTVFNDCEMKMAKFGDMKKFRSTIINKKYVDELKEAKRILFKLTEIQMIPESPCTATQNLRKCLEKVMNREYIRRHHLLGTVLKGGIPMDECLKVALKKKYFYEENEYIKLNPYYKKEIKDFVEDLELSPIMGEILEKICKETQRGCKHVPS